MNLQEVLERNKSKTLKIQYKIKPVSIASEDRPYDIIKTQALHSSSSQTKQTPQQTKVSNTGENKNSSFLKSNDITDDKVETNWRRNNDKIMTNWRQKEGLNSITNDEPETNWRQTNPQTSDISNDKLLTKKEQNKKSSFSSLTGLQRFIALSIYTLCKVSRDKKTKEVSIAQLSYCCKSTIKSVKKSVFRLIEKGIIYRDGFKNGRGGWTVYYLPNDIYQEIMNMENDNNLLTNWRQTGDKLTPKLMTDNYSSSSSSIYIKTTTTGEPLTSPFQDQSQHNLNAPWSEIDIEPLSSIGFTKTHLSQIASQNKLPYQLIQDSIHAFAFDLQENEKAKNIKGDPINYFMGILRKAQPYLTPSNYESPQDKAMRLYRENMRVIEQKRVEAEKEAITLAFNDWFAKLTYDQKIEFLPEMFRRSANSEKLGKSKALESSARSHFEAEVWPIEKAKIVANKG